MTTARLTWTRLANGDLLCHQHPIRLRKPLDRRAESPGWYVEVPWEPNTVDGHPDGWWWRTVESYDPGWDLTAGTLADAKVMVARNLDYILNHDKWGNGAYPEWTAEQRAVVVEAEEKREAEFQAKYGHLTRRTPRTSRAPRKPSLRAAARGVDEAWARYAAGGGLDGMADAVKRLRDALG